MLRTRIRVRDTTFYLAQGHEPEDLKSAMVDALRAGGGFVRFVDAGERTVSVLISPGVAVVIEQEEVAADPFDDADGRTFFVPAVETLSFVSFDETDAI